ncbi:SDR family NAD(P)-dependent oxidoreductase [Caulobacter sp. KR2-114]|uniref:SDR family NAD(P)-dependent oxidoreductase n=1 Tax=Caulobacter sp. KR2-114 TaxID=3400912 RepID=UPI003C02D004
MTQTSLNKASFTGAAVVTGASSGIGAIYADRLARRGHDLVLVARDEARLNALAQRLRAETGVKVDVIRADLSKREDSLKIEALLRDDAGVGALINNAGLSVAGPLTGGDPDRIQTIIDLNITAATRLAIAAATGFAARGQGLIVNVASVLALAPEISNGVYSGSKAFVLNLSQALNIELAGKGVRVQAVLPGATRTEIWERAGLAIDAFPPEMIMEADEMVDAALAGLDAGEPVTIPSLPDLGDWTRLDAARQALRPNLSRNRAADRYKAAETV